jgi:hypothetical protein
VTLLPLNGGSVYFVAGSLQGAGATVLPFHVKAGDDFKPRSARLAVARGAGSARELPVGNFYDDGSKAYRIPLASLLTGASGNEAAMDLSVAGESPATKPVHLTVKRAASVSGSVLLAWSGSAAGGPGPCTLLGKGTGGKRAEVASSADAESLWWLTAHAGSCQYGSSHGAVTGANTIVAVRQGAIIARLAGVPADADFAKRLQTSLHASLVFSGDAAAYQSTVGIKHDAWRHSLGHGGNVLLLLKDGEGANGGGFVEVSAALLSAYGFAADFALAHSNGVFSKPVKILARGTP